MGERIFYRCHHDGLGHGAWHDRYQDAWMEMHRLQPQSVAWAFKWEGWSIEEVTEDGTIVTKTEI